MSTDAHSVQSEINCCLLICFFALFFTNFQYFVQLKGGEGIAAIKRAIDIGYRHLDTAFLYNNEQEVGEAIRDKISENVIKRSDMFVVTKVNFLPDYDYYCYLRSFLYRK